MPVSKHRRKRGGKSVRHPGRGKVPTIPPLPPDLQAWQKFRDGYIAPFRAALDSLPRSMGDMFVRESFKIGQGKCLIELRVRLRLRVETDALPGCKAEGGEQRAETTNARGLEILYVAVKRHLVMGSGFKDRRGTFPESAFP